MTRTRVKSLGSCETTLFDVPAWTPDQLDRRACAERGECVVANFRKDKNGRRIDEALLAGEAVGRYVRIDRKTDLENAFEIPTTVSEPKSSASSPSSICPTKPPFSPTRAT
jgi:hypothetical protein